MLKQFYLFKKARDDVEDNTILTIWDHLKSWTSQNDWISTFFIILLGIIFVIILTKICTSFQKKPAHPENGSLDFQENEDSSLTSMTFDNWSIHSSSEERVDDFSERTITSSLTSEESENNVEKRVSPADEIIWSDTSDSKYQVSCFSESHTASSNESSSFLSLFHSEINKNFLSHRGHPKNEHEVKQCSSKELFSMMKTNKNKSLVFPCDFNFSRASGITIESKDVDVAPCPPAHLFLSRDQVRLLEENVKIQISLKSSAPLESKGTQYSRSQEFLIQDQHSVRRDISAQAQDSFPRQTTFQNQGFYETQFTSQAQQFVNNQDLINSQPDIESRYCGLPQNLRKKPFSSSTQHPFQTQDSKIMQDERIYDAFHNVTHTTLSEPPDTEMQSRFKAKTDTSRIVGLTHSMVKQEELPDEKKIWNAKDIEKTYIFKKPQEHGQEEEALQEAVPQLIQDFRFNLQLKQKPEDDKFDTGQGSSGSRKTQNKEEEVRPQILSTQTILRTSPCPTMDPFQVEKVKQSTDRYTGRETTEPKNPLTVPENLPAGEVLMEIPECGVPFGESPRKTLDNRVAEEKQDLKRVSPAIAQRSFIIHMLPLSYFKRQKISKRLSGTKRVLNPKCINMKVKKTAILLMPYINRHGTPSHKKRLRGNFKILITQMLPDEIMTDMLLNVTAPHVSILPHIRTHNRSNTQNHSHTKLKKEKSQVEREEKYSNSINKESDSGNTLEESKLQDEVRGDKDTPPKAVLHDTPPNAVLQDTPPNAVLRYTPPRAVLRVTPPRAVLRDTPPRAVLRVTPPRAVLRDTPPRGVLEDTSPRRVLQVTFPRAVLQNTPPRAVLEDTSPRAVLEDTLPRAVLEDTLPRAVLEDTLPRAVLQDTPPRAVLQDTLPRAVLQDTPPNTVLQDTPPRGVPEDISPRAVLQDTPPRVVFQDTLPRAVLQDTPPRSVLQDTPPNTVLQDIPPRGVLEDISPRAVLQDTLPRAVFEDTSPRAVLQDTPPRAVLQDTPPRVVLQDTLPRAVLQDTPPRSVLQDTPLNTVLQDTPPRVVLQDTLPRAVLQDTPPRGVLEDTLPTAVLEDTSPRAVLQDTPPRVVLQDTLPTAVLHDTPPNTVLQDTPPRGVLQDTSPRGILQDTLPRAVLEDTSPRAVLQDTLPRAVLHDTPPRAVLHDTPPRAVLEDTPPRAVLQDTPPRAVLRDTPPRAVLRDTPPRAVLRDTPPRAVLRDTPPRAVLRDTPPRAVLRDTPPRAVLRDTPPRAVLGDTPPRAVLGDTPPRAVFRDTPPRAVLRDTPPRAVLRDTPPRALLRDTPPRTVLWDTPPRGVFQDTPPRAVLQDTPPRAVLQDTPPRAVLQDTLPRAVLQDTPPRAVLQDTLPRTILQDTPPRAVLQDTLPRGVLQDTPPRTVLQDTSPRAVLQDTLPRAVLQDTSPRAVLQDTLPRAVLQDTLPRAVLQDTLPRAVLQDTLPRAVLQDTLPRAVLQDTSPRAVLHDSWNIRSDAHPEELKTEEDLHQRTIPAETIMEPTYSFIMDPSQVQNMKKSLRTQTDLKCTADSEMLPTTSEKSLIGDPLNQIRENDVSDYRSDAREIGYCLAETRAEFPKDLPATYPENFNCHMPVSTHSKVKKKRVRFSHINYRVRPKSIHVKTVKPSVSQSFDITGHREKLESNFKTKFEKINQANGLVYKFINTLFSPMQSRSQVEANGFCRSQLEQGEVTDERRTQYVDFFYKNSELYTREEKVQDGEEVEAASQPTQYFSTDACQGNKANTDEPDPTLNCLTQEVQSQTCFTQTALQTGHQIGPREAEGLQKTNKTENDKTAPVGLKIPSPKAWDSSLDKHLNTTTEYGLQSGENPRKQLDSYFVGKNSELPNDLKVTFLKSSDSVKSFVSKSKKKKNTSKITRKQIRASCKCRTMKKKKLSILHMLNDSQSNGPQCNLKTKLKNPQQNKNVDAFLDIIHPKVPLLTNIEMSSRLNVETAVPRLTGLGHMQLMQEKQQNGKRVCCPDSIDMSNLSNSVKNGKEEKGEREALPAPENSQGFIFSAYQENSDLVESDEELKQQESINIQVQPQIHFIQTTLDSVSCPILDQIQFAKVENSARFCPPKSGEAKCDEIILSSRECGFPSDANHQKEQYGSIEKKETVTFDFCVPTFSTFKRKRNFKKYSDMKTLVSTKCGILKAKKPTISYMLNIKGGTRPNKTKELGVKLTTKKKDLDQGKKMADKNINTYSKIEKDMLGENRLNSKQMKQVISPCEGNITSDDTKETNLQSEEEEDSEQERLLHIVPQHIQHFIFCSGEREELDLHKSESERSRKILFIMEQDVSQQMQTTDPMQTEKPKRSHQTQNGTLCPASSKLPLLKSKESLIGEVLIDMMKCGVPSDGSHTEKLHSHGKEEKAEFKKDQQATVTESLNATTPEPPHSKRQRKTFACTAFKSKMNSKCVIMKAKTSPISQIFNIPRSGCLKKVPLKTLKSQMIDFLIHINYSAVLEDLTVERKEGLTKELSATILESSDFSTLALPPSKRNNLKLIHNNNKMSAKCITLKAKKAPISKIFNITKHGTLRYRRQFEFNFKTTKKQDKPVAISSAMPISFDMKVHNRIKVETDMPWKMKFRHELRQQEQSPDGERAWCEESSTSNTTKQVQVRGSEASLWDSQHFSFHAYEMKEPHLVKSDLALKNSSRKRTQESLTTAQELQETLFTQSVLGSISCSILNALPFEKLPKRTKTQKGLKDTRSPKSLSPMPGNSVSDALTGTAQSGIPFEKSPRKELASSIPEGKIRLQKDLQVRTHESFDFSMLASSKLKGQGNATQTPKSTTGEAQTASVLRTVNITRSGALSRGNEQNYTLENTTKEIPLGMSNILLNTIHSSTPVSPAIKTHAKVKAKKGLLRNKSNITQLTQDEGKRLYTYSFNKWSTSNNTSESKQQSEKEKVKESNEMSFKAHLQSLNSMESRKDQNMLIAEQEVQQQTLVSKNILELICPSPVPFQIENLKKNIPPQKDIRHRTGEKISQPKSTKAMFDNPLINEMTSDGSPARKLDASSDVPLQPEEEMEDIKTQKAIKYTVDQTIPPAKSGNSVLGDACNKRSGRKMGGHIAKKHKELQRDFLKISTSVLSVSTRQKKILKFSIRKSRTGRFGVATKEKISLCSQVLNISEYVNLCCRKEQEFNLKSIIKDMQQDKSVAKAFSFHTCVSTDNKLDTEMNSTPKADTDQPRVKMHCHTYLELEKSPRYREARKANLTDRQNRSSYTMKMNVQNEKEEKNIQKLLESIPCNSQHSSFCAHHMKTPGSCKSKSGLTSSDIRRICNLSHTAQKMKQEKHFRETILEPVARHVMNFLQVETMKKGIKCMGGRKTAFPKAGKSETALIQFDTPCSGNPSTKWDSPVSEKKAWNKNDLAITIVKPLELSILDSSEPKSQSSMLAFVGKKSIMSPKHVMLKAKKIPISHMLNITGCPVGSHKKKKQHKFKYKMKEKQWDESVREALFHAPEGAKIPPPKLVMDKTSFDTSERSTLHNRTLYKNLEEMTELGEHRATTFLGPLDFFMPLLSDSESQINTVQLSKKKIILNPKCLPRKKKEKLIAQILKVNRKFTTRHRKNLRFNSKIKMREMRPGKHVAHTFLNAIYFTVDSPDIKQQSRLKTEIDGESRFSPLQPTQMDLPVEGLVTSQSLNVTGHSAFSINKEQAQKIDVKRDQTVLNADLKFRHDSTPIQPHIKMKHSPSTWDIDEESSEKRNTLNKAKVREKDEYRKQVLFRTTARYTQPFEFGADQMREPGPFQSEAPLINTARPEDITTQKTDIDLIDQKAEVKAVDEFSPESVSFSKIHPLQIKKRKKFKAANSKTIANLKILIPMAEKSLADVQSINAAEHAGSLQPRERMEQEGQGQSALHHRQRGPPVSGAMWSQAYTYTPVYPKIIKHKAKAKAADATNTVRTRQGNLKAKKPLRSQMLNTMGYGTQSRKKEVRCDLNLQKKECQQGKTIGDSVLSPVCDSGSIPPPIKGFMGVNKETDKPRKSIDVPPLLKVNKPLRRRMASSPSTDKSVISRSIKTLKQYIREQKGEQRTVLLDILSRCGDELVISQQGKEPDHVKLVGDLEREVYLGPSSQKRAINYPRFDIPQIRKQTEIEFLTAARVKDADVDLVERSVSFPREKEVSEKMDNSLSSKGQKSFRTDLEASQQKICKQQERLKRGSISVTNLETSACPIMEWPPLEDTGKVGEEDKYSNRKSILHLLGREELKEANTLQDSKGQDLLCIHLQTQQSMSPVQKEEVTADHIPESTLDSVSCPDGEPLDVKPAVSAASKENVNISISVHVNPWKKEEFKLTDIPLKSNRQKMNFSKKMRAKQLNSSNQNKENVLESISSCMLYQLYMEKLKKEVSVKGMSSTVTSPMVGKSSNEAGIPVDQPSCSGGITLQIRGRRCQQERMGILPTSTSPSSMGIPQSKSPWAKKALKAVDNPTYHTPNTEGKEEEQPESTHQAFPLLASHSLRDIFQSELPCKRKTLGEMGGTVDYTPSTEGIGSLIGSLSRKEEQQEKRTCEVLPKPASHSKTGPLQINAGQQIKLDDTNIMHCEYLTSQAKEVIKGMDVISEKRQNVLNIQQNQQHLLIPRENFLGHVSYPQNDPWLLGHVMPQTEAALLEVGGVPSRTQGLDLSSKDQPNAVCEYGRKGIVPSSPPRHMKTQNTVLPLESCSKTIKYLNYSFPKGKKSSDRAQVIDSVSNSSSPELRLRKKAQSYQKKVQNDVCLPGIFLHFLSVFVPILPKSKIQKNSVKQRVKKGIIYSKRRNLKLKKLIFSHLLSVTDCGTPGSRAELQWSTREKMVHMRQGKGKPDLVVTNTYEFMSASPHLKMNKQIIDRIILNNLKRAKQHISQKKEKDEIKGVNMKERLDLNVILKAKKSSRPHILTRKEQPVPIEREGKVQVLTGHSDVQLTDLCACLPSLSHPNSDSRIKVGKDTSETPRSCLPALKLRASPHVRETSFVESMNRDSLSNVIEPKQHLPQKKWEDRENTAYVEDIMGLKCISFRGKKTHFKHILHEKEPQWDKEEQEKTAQEDESDLATVPNKSHASVPSPPNPEQSPGVKEVHVGGLTRLCFPSLTLQELSDAMRTCEESTDDDLSSTEKAQSVPQKDEHKVEMTLEDISHPKRIALKEKQPPMAQELRLNIEGEEKTMPEGKDKQVGIQSKFCASVSSPYSEADARIQAEAAVLIKTRSSFLQQKFQGSSDVGKMAYKKSMYGDVSISVKKAKEHIMQEKDVRIKMVKVIPLKKKKSPISQEIQWDIQEQERKIQNITCKSSEVLTEASTSMLDASHLKLDARTGKADCVTDATRCFLPEQSDQKSPDAEKAEHTKSFGNDIISNDIKTGQDYKPQKGENGGKLVNMNYITCCKGVTCKAKTLVCPHVLGTPTGCGPQIREVQTNIKENLGHIQERKNDINEVLTRPSLLLSKLNKGREGKAEKRGITRPLLPCSWQRESSDAGQLKYTVPPLSDITSDSKRTKYVTQKEEDNTYTFEKDIMHPLSAALKAKKSPLFSTLQTKEHQVKIKEQGKRGQESNKETTVLLSEICPFVHSLSHLKVDAIKEEEGEPGIIRNYGPYIELQQLLPSGQIASAKSIDSCVQKGKQHRPQKEQDRAHNRTNVDEDLLEVIGLPPVQLELPVSSGAGKIKHADSNEGISSSNVIIKCKSYKEAKDRVKIEGGKGRLFPKITVGAAISPFTHLLSRKRLHLNTKEQHEGVQKGKGEPGIVLRKTCASLPFLSHLKQDTRMNEEEDILAVTQTRVPPRKSQDPSYSGKKAYAKSFDGCMLEEEDRLNVDIEDKMQKGKVQEDKNKLVTIVENMCTSLVTLPYLKFDAAEEEEHVVRITKLPLPQPQPKELSNAWKTAYAETIDGELSNNIKELKEHMLQKGEKNREEKLGVNGRRDPDDMCLNVKKSPVSPTNNPGDLQWQTEEPEGKAQEVTCEPPGVLLTKTDTWTSSPPRLSASTRVKENTPTLTRSSVSPVQLQEPSDSEQAVHVGPIISDTSIGPREGKPQYVPQVKEEDGVEAINLVFPKHHEKKMQETKDEPGELLTQPATSLPSLPPRIKLDKEILVDDEVLVLKTSVLQRILNAGGIVHTEPIGGDIMKDVQHKQQPMPQEEGTDREAAVAMRCWTHSTDRTSRSKKSLPSYTLSGRDLHWNIGSQGQKKHEGQGKSSNPVVRKVYAFKPPPTHLKLDKGTQVDKEGQALKRPCRLPLTFSAVSDAEKIEDTEAMDGDRRKRKQHISLKEKLYEVKTVDMRVRLQRREAEISPITHLFNRKELVLNIKELRQNVHEGKDVSCVDLTRTFLFIPSASPLSLDSGSKIDKDALRITGSACPQKNLQESLNTQKTAIRESVSGNSKIIVKKAGHSVSQEEAVPRRASNFMTSVQQRKGTLQVTCKGDLHQFIVNSLHKDIYFTGFGPLGRGKGPECVLTEPGAQPEKYKTETFSSFLSYPTVGPTKIANLKKETEIIDNFNHKTRPRAFVSLPKEVSKEMYVTFATPIISNEFSASEEDDHQTSSKARPGSSDSRAEQDVQGHDKTSKMFSSNVVAPQTKRSLKKMKIRKSNTCPNVEEQEVVMEKQVVQRTESGHKTRLKSSCLSLKFPLQNGKQKAPVDKGVHKETKVYPGLQKPPGTYVDITEFDTIREKTKQALCVPEPDEGIPESLRQAPSPGWTSPLPSGDLKEKNESDTSMTINPKQKQLEMKNGKLKIDTNIAVHLKEHEIKMHKNTLVCLEEEKIKMKASSTVNLNAPSVKAEKAQIKTEIITPMAGSGPGEQRRKKKQEVSNGKRNIRPQILFQKHILDSLYVCNTLSHKSETQKGRLTINLKRDLSTKFLTMKIPKERILQILGNTGCGTPSKLKHDFNKPKKIGLGSESVSEVFIRSLSISIMSPALSKETVNSMTNPEREKRICLSKLQEKSPNACKIIDRNNLSTVKKRDQNFTDTVPEDSYSFVVDKQQMQRQPSVISEANLSSEINKKNLTQQTEEVVPRHAISGIIKEPDVLMIEQEENEPKPTLTPTECPSMSEDPEENVETHVTSTPSRNVSPPGIEAQSETPLLDTEECVSPPERRDQSEHLQDTPTQKAQQEKTFLGTVPITPQVQNNAIKRGADSTNVECLLPLYEAIKNICESQVKSIIEDKVYGDILEKEKGQQPDDRKPPPFAGDPGTTSTTVCPQLRPKPISGCYTPKLQNKLINHLESKALEINLNQIPEMAKQSFQEFNFYPNLVISEGNSWRLDPRHNTMHCLSLEGIDSININLKHIHQKDSPHISCTKTLIVNVSNGSKENTTRRKSINKLKGRTSSVTPVNEMSLSHILQNYSVGEKDKLLTHFSVKTLEIQMKAFPRIIMESHTMADRRKTFKHSGVKVPKPKNKILLLLEEIALCQMDLVLQYKFLLGLPVESMSPEPNTLPKHSLKLNTGATCEKVDQSGDSDSLSIDTELLGNHTSFKKQSPHENSSLIRQFLEPTHVCAADPEQHRTEKKDTSFPSVLKSHQTPVKEKQHHPWFQEINTHESFDLKTKENAPSLVDSQSVQFFEDFPDSQTYIENSADSKESKECLVVEANPYLSQESQNILLELQKSIPLENVHKRKKIKTDKKSLITEDSVSHHTKGYKQHSLVLTPTSSKSHKSKRYKSSSKTQSPNWLCHSEEISWITRNRTSYSLSPLIESNIKLPFAKSQDKPHRYSESKEGMNAKFDLFRKNVHWDFGYTYTQRKEKCTRKKTVCGYESERADYFIHKRKSASKVQEDSNFYSERKPNQPFFYVCMPADSLEIMPKTVRWTLAPKTLKKTNFRVPLVASISSSCDT